MAFLNETNTNTNADVAKPSYPRKKAICMGINDYPGTNSDLKGCINDLNNWSSLLADVYGFNVKSLSNSKVRYGTVTKLMGNYISDSRAGDYIVITFSGHGTNVADRNGDESDGRDEALCLYDRYLVDDCIRKMMKGLHPEANLTFIADCCHSGSITREFLSAMNGERYLKPRFLPPEDEYEILTSRTSDISHKLFYPEDGMKELLISGCLPSEYSYDAYIGGKFQGAMSYFATKIIRRNPTITYENFYKMLRGSLPTSILPQTPQLEGTEENKKRIMFT